MDADHDGYGNACDSDFNEDDVLTFVDLAILRSFLFKPPGPSVARRASALLRTLALSLLLLGCSDIFIFTLRVSIADYDLLGSQRFDRDHFDFTYRAHCVNVGPPADAVVAVLQSHSPATTIVEGTLRCGPVGTRSSVASLDTFTIRQDRKTPFDPSALVWIVAAIGNAESRETDDGPTRIQRGYRVSVTNRTADPEVARVLLASARSTVVVSDDRADLVLRPGITTVTSDLVEVVYERGALFDAAALSLTLQLLPGPTGDLDGNGRIDATDVSRAGVCTGHDPKLDCSCALADLDLDGKVDSKDVDRVTAAIGRTGLPIALPDEAPPHVGVTTPLPDARVATPLLRVSGTSDEALFRLSVNGVEASVDPFSPFAWSAVVPLQTGPNPIVISAVDRACLVGDGRIEVTLDTTDRSAPFLRFAAPDVVQAGSAFHTVIEVRDDREPVSLELFVDGVRAAAGDRTPLVFDGVAPDAPGGQMSLRGVARDVAGNATEVSASVAIVSTADDAPPIVTSLILPPSVAPGTRFRVRANATDDRGVAQMRFESGGSATATDAVAPFEAELVAPADAAPGSSLRVEATATDGAGLAGHATGNVAVVAAPDTRAPVPVSLVAPSEAAAGARVFLSAAAQDDLGVAVLRFFVNGGFVGEDESAPYELVAPLPAGAVIGDDVLWTVRASDFAGNETGAGPASTRIVASRDGVVAGEVYDDSKGRPLAGASVAAVEIAGVPAGAASTTQTDSRGRYRLALAQGRMVLRIARPGFVSAVREVEVPPDGVGTPLDARLTPIGVIRAMARREGGLIALDGATAELQVAPGALSRDANVGLTALSAQALPLPLPIGWTPLAAFAVGVDGASVELPLALDLGDPPTADASSVVVALDADSRKWHRAKLEPSTTTGRVRVLVSSPTTVAFVRPDSLPDAPPMPIEGAALAGLPARSLASDASVELSPSPRIVFAGPDARASVSALLLGAVPSGTRIEIAARESYVQIDDGRLEPEPFTQDLLLFSSANGPAAGFVATPDPTVDALRLREGVVTLEAGPPPTDRAVKILSDAGGLVVTPAGAALEVLPGAVSGRVVVALESLDPATLGLPADVRFAFVAGATVDLGGALLRSAAPLTFPTTPGAASGETLLLLQLVRLGGVSELALVGVAKAGNGSVTVTAGGAGLELPGVREEGRYVLARPTGAVAFLTGAVGGDGASGATVVRVSTLPFVSVARPDAPGAALRFVLVSPLGSVTLRAVDAVSGNEGSATLTLSSPSEVAVRDLPVAPPELVVVSVTPPDGAENVAAGLPIAVQFSRPFDPASLGLASVALAKAASVIGTQLTPSADRLSLIVTPTAPLESDSQYQLTLAPALRDAFGNGLRGGEPDGSFLTTFRTADTTPPPRPAAGQIGARYPEIDLLELAGTQGSAEPGASITASNARTGAAVTVVAGVDGAFSLRIIASPSDGVSLVFSDRAGNRSDVPVVRPVVLTDLRVAPDALVFLAAGRDRLLSLASSFSDGSGGALDPAQARFESSDPAVATVDATGKVIPVGDGDAQIRASFGEAPFTRTASVPVSVRFRGVVLAEQTVDAAGAEIELEGGFALSIPAGALPGPTTIRIEEIPLTQPLAFSVQGVPGQALALYRMSPDIAFAKPVVLAIPVAASIVAGLSDDDDLFLATGTSPALDDLEGDGVDGDDEDTEQHLDRLNHVLRVRTTHLSFRVLMQIDDGDISTATNDELLQDGVKVPILDLVGTHAFADKSRPDEFVVWHGTNPGINGDFQLQFPSTEVVGTQYKFTISSATNGGGAKLFFDWHVDRQTITKSVSSVRRIGFTITSVDDSCDLEIEREVPAPGGTTVTVSHTLAIKFSDFAGPAVPPVALTSASTGGTITADLRGQKIYSAEQNRQILDSLPKEFAAQFYVTPRGKIYRLYQPTKRVLHTASGAGSPNANNLSTGIEIQHSTNPFDLYSGPQIDALMALTDFLLNRTGQKVLEGSRARRRNPTVLATQFPPIDRSRDRIGEFEPAVTHEEANDDYFDTAAAPHNVGLADGACDTPFRKADPCGKTFELEALSLGLAYDFPGLIDTSGGDLLKSKPSLVPARGGRVVLRYGVQPGSTADPMHINQFAGIPGTSSTADRRYDVVEILRVDAGQTLQLPAGLKDGIANLVVRGTLKLSGDTTLRISGTTYVAPGGRIVGPGHDLTILAAGPVMLQGAIDLSGPDAVDTQPGHGGDLTVLSRAHSPLLVPTIVTQGGDVWSYEQESPAELGGGGEGGDVLIDGPPDGLIVFSGLKQIPSVVACSDADQPATDGHQLPINYIPQDFEQVAAGAHYESAFPDPAAGCRRVVELNLRRGLARTLGRGIVTSGGMGASARGGSDFFSTNEIPGAPGGDGGDIRIRFPQDHPGVIRFRGVSLIAGGGTGTLSSHATLALARTLEPVTAPLVQLTGGGGGRGQPGHFRSFIGLEFFGSLGGDGGAGGAAGEIEIDPAAKVFPLPTANCTKRLDLLGHDASLPKDDVAQVVGRAVTLCAPVEGGAPLELVTLNLEAVPEEDGNTCSVNGEGGACTNPRVLGGSGGLVGGSPNNSVSSSLFNAKGTSGRFGERGPGGTLTVPDAMLGAMAQ